MDDNKTTVILKNILMVLVIIIVMPLSFGSCFLCLATCNVATQVAE